MSCYWIIRNKLTGEEQLVESAGDYAPYDPEHWDIAELPHEIDAAQVRWDWDAREIVPRATPQEARDRRWREAQEYRELRRNAPLPVWGVFPDRPVIANMSPESRITIMGAFAYANFMTSQGLASSFTFKDAGGTRVTLDNAKTIALGLNVAVYSGACDTALDDIEDALNDALAAGATATEILAINITAGYPTPAGAGDPPEQPET